MDVKREELFRASEEAIKTYNNTQKTLLTEIDEEGIKILTRNLSMIEELTESLEDEA